MKCNIARDLIPLYFEGMCSDETGKELEEHLEHCESCRQLKQSLEPEQVLNGGAGEWDKEIAPFKKVRKKMRRKDGLIAVCIIFILLLAGTAFMLAYGQIARKGISFESVYDGIRFRKIGKQFAAGNIEPLYDVLSSGYLLQDEESSVVRLAYADRGTYDEDMKKAILEKYHQYFDGKNLIFKGIEEIGYQETMKMGGDRTLYISLKFEGEDGIEYYIAFYKTLNGQYLAEDYFGNPYLIYTAEEVNGTEEGNQEEGELTQEAGGESFHTQDSLFSCLPNKLKDIDLYMMRYMVMTSGQRALQGDTALADNGQMRLSLLSEQDFEEGTYSLCMEAEAGLENLAERGYYLTDITWTPREYDKTRHLYLYQVTMELTGKDQDEIIVTLDCYRISDKFVFIPGSDEKVE